MRNYFLFIFFITFVNGTAQTGDIFNPMQATDTIYQNSYILKQADIDSILKPHIQSIMNLKFSKDLFLPANSSIIVALLNTEKLPSELKRELFIKKYIADWAADIDNVITSRLKFTSNKSRSESQVIKDVNSKEKAILDWYATSSNLNFSICNYFSNGLFAKKEAIFRAQTYTEKIKLAAAVSNLDINGVELLNQESSFSLMGSEGVYQTLIVRGKIRKK